MDPRLLRAFVAVAGELHFTRAAARLYVAQQALSRDIRRLERELGAELFVRTTRQVTLTADGERLLPHARRVLAAQDDLLAAAAGTSRPLLVDLNSEGMASGRVLARAREIAPECELMARFESGLTGAAAEIVAGRLDVSFGRFAGLEPAVRALLSHQPVRYEPMAVLLPHDHPLAGLARIPLDALAGESVYAGAGNPRTLEWTDLARRLFAGRGIRIAPPAPVAIGAEEFRRVMAKTRNPVLAVVDFPAVPDSVLRPVVDPVPLSPLSLVWRKGLRHPGIDALRAAAATTDQAAVEEALRRTGTTQLRDQPVDQLSGGQRQRAWIALALAQDTDLLLLDEPTTFLDLRHQLDVLDLVAELHAEAGRTVVMVLHDLGQAARYADHLVVLKDGQLAAAGAPAEVLDAELVKSVFDVECRVIPDPETGTPLVVPRGRAARQTAVPA